MNAGQLSAWFEQNKTVALGVAAAGVAGLALLQRRKSSGGAATGATAGASVPGTSPAAGVVPTGGSLGGTYDSSTSDLYNALQPQLEQILQTTGHSGINDAPAPIASSLLAPTYNGNYVWARENATGSGPGAFEVESDGSLLHLNTDQWGQAAQKAGSDRAFTMLDSGWNGNWYDSSQNLSAISQGATTGTASTLDQVGKVISAPKKS